MASKKEQSLELYKQMAAASADNSVDRKAFIGRCVAELGMTPAGASTYYSNSKSAAAGTAPKSYYVASADKAVTQAVDDSKVTAPLWSLVVVDNDVVDDTHSYMSKKGAVDRWNALKPGTQARCLVVEGSPLAGTAISALVKVDTTVAVS